MDTENLLKLLNAHKVRYVIIGASAFPIYGYVRATLDIDIFIEPKMKNAEKTLNALSEFGYDMEDVNVNELLTKKILIRQYDVETDIHPFVSGVTFDEVWKNKVRNKYGSTATFFAELNDLIKMKKAAGRQKDLDDLKHLILLKGKKKT
jgi:predicted nucleotidyltransferase